MWGTSGIAYNEEKIKEIDPNAPVNSFAMFYDPNVIKKFQKCGISMLDAPGESRRHRADLPGQGCQQREAWKTWKAAEKVLMSIRPYIRKINSSAYIDNLANGECVPGAGLVGRRAAGRHPRRGEPARPSTSSTTSRRKARCSSSTTSPFRPMRRT